MSQALQYDYIRTNEARDRFKVSRRNFVDPNLLEREKAVLFDKCWLYLGHDSELEQAKDFIVRTVGGRSILFNKGLKGTVNAFLNVCPHRGGPVCREKKGRASAFQCFYHGWVFGPDGELRFHPYSENYPSDFAKDPASSLTPVPRLESYAGFWFVCFDRNTEPLVDYLAGATEYLDRAASYSTDQIIVQGAHEYNMRANWKLLMENTHDRYHADTTHASYWDYLKDLNSGAISFDLTESAKKDADETSALLMKQGAPLDNAIVKDLGNGHSVIELTGPWGRPIARWHPAWGPKVKEEIDETYNELAGRLGPEKAQQYSTRSFLLGIFPNFAIVDVHTTNIRTVYPTSADEMSVSNWSLAPRNEKPLLRKIRLANTMEFLGPGGFGTPDDVAALEACQRGYHSNRDGWNDISGGMLPGMNIGDSEEELRVFWKEWDRRMRGAE